MPFHDDSSLWTRPAEPKRTLEYVDLPARQRVVHEAERALESEPGSAAIIGPVGAGKRGAACR